MKKLLIFAFVLVFLACQVLAISPVLQGTSPEGLTVEAPLYESVRQNTPFQFEIHIYNNSNGVPIYNNVICYLHVYNTTGAHFFEGEDNTPSTMFDYSFTLDKNNFSELGEIHFLASCNTSIRGGFISSSTIVSKKGVILSTAHALIYSLLLIVCFLFMGLALFGSIKLDGKNEFSLGKVISINYNKYIKQGLFLLSYLFLIFTVFFASEISSSFLMLNFTSEVLNFLHIALWIAFIPIFTIFVIFSLIKWMADLELMDLAKRNLKVYGA